MPSPPSAYTNRADGVLRFINFCPWRRLHALVLLRLLPPPPRILPRIAAEPGARRCRNRFTYDTGICAVVGITIVRPPIAFGGNAQNLNRTEHCSRWSLSSNWEGSFCFRVPIPKLFQRDSDRPLEPTVLPGPRPRCRLARPDYPGAPGTYLYCQADT